MHKQDPLILRMRAVRTNNFYGSIIQDALCEIERLHEQLACVRQALPAEWRDSVPSVAVATLVELLDALPGGHTAIHDVGKGLGPNV